MSDRIAAIAALLEQEYGVTYFESRDAELVRGLIDGRYVIEAFPTGDGAEIKLSYPVADHRRADDYDEVLATMEEMVARIPVGPGDALTIHEEGWVVYANRCIAAADDLPAALAMFIAWVRANG